MENAPDQPEKPAIPTPNLPKPNLPTPNLPKPSIPTPNVPAPSIPTPSLPKTPSLADGPPVMPAVNVPPKVEEKVEESPEESDGRAPFNTRILAALIDVGVAIGLQVCLSVVPFVGKIGWLVGLAYLLTRDALPFLGGQSIGKKAMKLRAVKGEDEPLTGNWEPALIRNAVLLIPFFPFVELYILLTREDNPKHGLRLGDEWAKTKVIVVKPEPTEEEEAD